MSPAPQHRNLFQGGEDGNLSLGGEDGNLSLGNEDGNLPCPAVEVFPSLSDFQQGLGSWAVVLYVSCVIVWTALGIQYSFLVRQFTQSLQSDRLVHTLWVTSVFFVLSTCNMVSTILPLASEFIWLAYKIFLSIAQVHFVDLTLSWYGGETTMINHVGEDKTINFRKPPCCCCCCLPRSTTLTKAKIRFMKGSVYQVPYFQSICLFILGSLQISGYVELGSLSFSSPYMYITVLLALSNMSGLWGLFMFFNITHQFNLLDSHNYKKKSTCMKLIIVLINIQGFIVDILVNQGVVPCIAEYVSRSGMGMVVKAVCILLESGIIGTLSFLIYKDEGTHL